MAYRNRITLTPEEFARTHTLILEAIKDDLLIYDHEANGTGYVKKGKEYIESYNGKFGTGYIIHYSTNAKKYKSTNNLHPISYVIESPFKG